jgi:hypothetical protein
VIYDNTVVRRSVSPAVVTNGTINGVAVNLGAYGAESAIVVVTTGTVTDGSHAFSIEESDTGAGAWTAVPVGRLTSAAPTVLAANDDTLYEVGVTPLKAYLRVVVVTTAATTGGLLAAVVVVGEPGTVPVSHA